MNNLYRLIAIGIYPIILTILLLYVCKTRFKDTIKEYWKAICVSLIFLSVIVTVGLIVYYHFEDAIYVYDNAGYYVRSLELVKMFWEEPSNILGKVFYTINTEDYSYLPSLFNFYGLLVNNSYVSYCLINYYLFLLPSLFLLELLYYRYYSNKLIPSMFIIGFYPLWITIFYGRVDVLGIFPLLIFYIITLFTDYEKITKIDTLLLNFLTLLLMFERRWYLYSLVGIYLAYLIKSISHAIKTKKYKEDIIKFIGSGILALVVLVFVFKGFINNVVFNSQLGSYSYYDASGKPLEAINYFSYLLCLLALYGIIKLWFKDKIMAVNVLLLIIVPSVLFWQIQVFDIQHHLIIALGLMISGVCGLMNLPYKKICISLVSVLLVFQTLVVFSEVNIPLFTTVKKRPEYNAYKQQLTWIAEYLQQVSSSEGVYTYFATGNYQISDDAVKYSLLPSLNFPNIVSYVLDDRDGFPKNIETIRYIVISDPILYRDENYQHMYSIITDAILNNEEISSIYEYQTEFKVGSTTLYIYKLVGNYTQSMKEYFYNRMLEYYPDKGDFYSYILE